MMAYLFKLVAKRNNAKLVKGMSVEILKKNSSTLTLEDVAEAINRKYNSDVHKSHCGLGNFEIERINK